MKANAGRLTAWGLALLLATLGVTEGTKYFAYRDSGGVWTYCTGLTDPDDLRLGIRYTPEQCRELDEKNAMMHDAGIAACIDPNIEIPQGRWVAYAHFAFNVGVYSFCRSTLAKRINAGDQLSSCSEMLRWKYVAGRDCTVAKNNCRGIPKRRAFESQWCSTTERPPLSMLN